jgi:hypothetical protein
VTPDDQIHSQVELATRLRHDYASGVYGKVSNNRHTEEAYEKILELLDTSHGRKLTDDEKRSSVGYFVGWPSLGGTVKPKPQRGFHWRLQSNSSLETPGPRGAYSGVLQLIVT